LYVALVGSRKASARIVNVDPSVALAIPGVVGYIDHKSVPGFNETGAILPSPVFAVDEVRAGFGSLHIIATSKTATAPLIYEKLEIKLEN
jgi:xanthine dehydrogenase molybdopterin-binding subunit B